MTPTSTTPVLLIGGMSAGRVLSVKGAHAPDVMTVQPPFDEVKHSDDFAPIEPERYRTCAFKWDALLMFVAVPLNWGDAEDWSEDLRAKITGLARVFAHEEIARRAAEQNEIHGATSCSHPIDYKNL